jgi:hypothetical protein
MPSYMINDDNKTPLNFNDIFALWIKFRDLRVLHNKDLHWQYCELIQSAIGRNDSGEAYRLLQEGMERYSEAKEDFL